MKILPLLIIAFMVFAGCTPLAPPPPEQAPADAAALLFDRGLEQLGKGAAPEALERLSQEFPASPWNQRAEQVMQLHQRSERLATQQNRTARRQQTLEKELAAREAYIQQLKELIIRNERTR